MAFLNKKKNVQPIIEEVVKDEDKEITEVKEEIKVEEKIEKEEPKKEEKKSIKVGAKIVANGRCFGSENLECPLKAVRNYETKIIEISENSVLIDEGWISKENIK